MNDIKKICNIETTKVWFASFKASAIVTEKTKEFLKRLGFQDNYKVARLALGRSLGESSFPESASDSGNQVIKGHTLFGEEENGGLLWLSLLIENIHHFYPDKEITLDILQQAVKDHWQRGILLLDKDWDESGGEYSKFIELLITRRATLPSDSNYVTLDSQGNEQNGIIAKPITLNLGHDINTNEPVNWLINGRGYSPNIALMGQANSGKTGTMLKLIQQAQQQSNAPVILLDIGKGDLADKTELVKSLNAEVLRIPEQAIPLDMFQKTNESDSAAHILQSFRDSFERAMPNKPGAKQLDAFREALKPLFQNQERITIQAIKSELDRYYTDNKIKTDSIVATINDLIQFKLFEPNTSPDEFFKRNWIITFGNAQDTTKKLASALLIDALHNYMKRCSESPTDNEGYRGLRLILAIDESKPLLANRHPGLSNLLRLHRSKGLCVMLASQSPDDYDGAADDYMEQIGLPVCFRTNATSTAVLNNMFKGKQNFSALEPGTCLTVIENTTKKVKAF